MGTKSPNVSTYIIQGVIERFHSDVINYVHAAAGVQLSLYKQWCYVWLLVVLRDLVEIKAFHSTEGQRGQT